MEWGESAPGELFDPTAGRKGFLLGTYLKITTESDALDTAWPLATNSRQRILIRITAARRTCRRWRISAPAECGMSSTKRQQARRVFWPRQTRGPYVVSRLVVTSDTNQSQGTQSSWGIWTRKEHPARVRTRAILLSGSIPAYPRKRQDLPLPFHTLRNCERRTRPQ